MRFLPIIILFCCCVLLRPLILLSQPGKIEFKHISNENGLSNSTVEAIFQDKRGFIWLGTRDGLNRFDGHHIITYRNNSADSNSLCDNYITSITEDAGQQLWIGTLNGISRFNPTTNQFKHFKQDIAKTNSQGNIRVSNVYCDKNNKVWIASYGSGVLLYQNGIEQLESIPVIRKTSGSPENHIYVLFEDSRNNLWAGTESGIYIYNKNTAKFEQATTTHGEPITHLAIRAIAEDKSGNLLLGTENNGLIIYNAPFRTIQWLNHHPTQPHSISSNLVRSILVTTKGDIWTGSVNGGLDYFDPLKKEFFNYQYQPDNPESLSQRTVSALLEDKQGNIWIGTHRGGVNLYMPGAQKFRLYRQRPEKNSLSYNDVKAFCEDHNGNIWIGTDGGGLNKFTRKTQSFSHYKYSPFHKETLGSNEVIAITEDKAGKLWVGTWGGGLCQYLPASDQFIRYGGPSYIQYIYEDSREQLWVATYYDGLHLFDRSTGKFNRVTRSKTGKTGIIGNNILSIIEDKDQNVWVGTDDGGLHRMDAQTGEFTHYFNNEEKKPDIRILQIDSKGNLWVGQSGLYLFNKSKNIFELFTTAGSLNELFIKGIVEDNSGILWIATSNGICKLNPATKEARSFNTVDGLQGQEFEANAFLKTVDGEVYFGGVNGFNSFYPTEITSNSFIPPVYITDFSIEDRKIIGGPANKHLTTDISYTTRIKLSYKEGTFSFSFAALNFTAAENNRFAYKLEGWDRDWIYAGDESKVSYTNVIPGNYTFYVKASNNDGLWNEAGRQIEILITPPFWQTWWFRLAVAAILLTGAYYFYQFRRKVQLERFEESKREELHELQLQFFTNISHEFRTPLSLITGPIEKLVKENPSSKNSNAYQIIQRNANRLLQLINELMDFRKAESGVLKLQVMPGSVPLFIEEIAEEFSELAAQKNIRFTVTLPELQQESWFDRQVLEKIIINLLSNSFKYTPENGVVQLQILTSLNGFKPCFENEIRIEGNEKAQSFLYFRIADNGIGISKESITHLFERYHRVSDAHMGSGIGLAFVKSLTQLHKGNIFVSSERNKGTEIIIGIPANRVAYTTTERWAHTKEKNVSLEAVLQQAQEKQSQVPATTQTETATNLQPVILIADDHEELRGFLKETLEEEFQVLEAPDGSKAWEITQESYPDIIVSDIMMPVLDGIGFCNKVKQSQEYAHIPFLMLTAKTSIDSQLEGTGSGADYYFTKPINTELLILSIRNILLQKEKLKARYRSDHHAEIHDLVHSSKDKEFMEELISIIEDNLTSPTMDIDFVCTQIGMSRTKLYNKVKNITGQSIGDFIRTLRLRRAAALMTANDLSLTDIMYSVGIQTQSYFSKAFKNEFGKTPTQFLKELEKR